MSYKIVIEKPAMKFLLKQPKNHRERIMKAIQALPNIGDIKSMAGHTNLYRLRVGDFRYYTLLKMMCLLSGCSTLATGAMYISDTMDLFNEIKSRLPVLPTPRDGYHQPTKGQGHKKSYRDILYLLRP